MCDGANLHSRILAQIVQKRKKSEPIANRRKVRIFRVWVMLAALRQVMLRAYARSDVMRSAQAEHIVDNVQFAVIIHSSVLSF